MVLHIFILLFIFINTDQWVSIDDGMIYEKYFHLADSCVLHLGLLGEAKPLSEKKKGASYYPESNMASWEAPKLNVYGIFI